MVSKFYKHVGNCNIIFDKNTKLNKLGVCITFYYSVFLCVYILSSGGFTSCLCCFTHQHPLSLDSALGGYEVNLGQSSDTTLLMFWCDTKFKTYFAIGITTDQLLEPRFLINIKFDLDLWYFLASIACYCKKQKNKKKYIPGCLLILVIVLFYSFTEHIWKKKSVIYSRIKTVYSAWLLMLYSFDFKPVYENLQKELTPIHSQILLNKSLRNHLIFFSSWLIFWKLITEEAVYYNHR